MFQSTRTSWASRLYVACVIIAGGIVVLRSALALYDEPVDRQWLLLAALTLLSGSITVKIPSVAATLSVSEAFVFTSVLIFGRAAGTVTAALDGLILSLWLRRKTQPLHRVFFNAAATSLSLWVGASLFLSLLAPEADAGSVDLARLLLPLGVFTAVYFLLDSSLVAVAIALDQGLSAIEVWKKN